MWGREVVLCILREQCVCAYCHACTCATTNCTQTCNHIQPHATTPNTPTYNHMQPHPTYDARRYPPTKVAVPVVSKHNHPKRLLHCPRASSTANSTPPTGAPNAACKGGGGVDCAGGCVGAWVRDCERESRGSCFVHACTPTFHQHPCTPPHSPTPPHTPQAQQLLLL